MRKKIALIIGIVIFLFFGKILFEGVKLTPVLFQYFFQKEIALKKTDDRVNVLLLGIGGGKHDGPLLTDTIIYASVDPKTNTITLVSLPRDLWIPEFKAKINTAYATGESKQKDGGLILAKAIVEKILNQPVDYVIRVDFNGFIKAIDMVGGLDILVNRSFEDFEYPISGKEVDTCGYTGEEFEKRATASSLLEAFPCRYEHVSFSKGPEHMNGERALRFVRSRHAVGVEGTDFARSERQEKVIESFKNKIFSLGTFLNPTRILSLYDVFKGSIHTDIAQMEYDDFIKLAQKMEKATIKSVVFYYTDTTEKESGFLINPPVNGAYHNQWVVIPRLGDGVYTEIQEYTACKIERKGCKQQGD